MLQNVIPLRKSAPWPPNISDEHVSCTAPATRDSSFQILFTCPMPAIVFETATKPSHFAPFWQGAQSLAPAAPKRHPKSGPGPSVLNTFDFEMCFAQQQRALFRHVNFQKCFEAGVLCTFWLGNRATTACTFSSSQLPKVLRPWCALHILTWKCASRTTTCTFSTSQLPKVVRAWCALWLRNVLRATTACNCSSLIWPDGSAPAALASLLFDPPEPQIIGKTQCFATFLPFPAPAPSFFWLFLFSDLLASSLLLSDSSHLCFSICPYCWKFDV